MAGQALRWDVLCLGEALVQLDQREDGAFVPDAGGDAVTVALSVARMGGQAALATRIGCDEFGDVVLMALDAAGVDPDLVQRDLTAPTAHMFRHRLGPISHRQFCREGSAEARMRPADLPAVRVAEARVLHLSGVTLGLSPLMRTVADIAVEQARKAGALVSFVPSFQPDLWSEDVGRGAALGQLRVSDIAFVRVAEAEFLFGMGDPKAVLDRLLGMGLQMVVLICDAGAWVATASGRTLAQHRGPGAVGAVVRPDVFVGTYLSGLTAGDDLTTAAGRALMAADIAMTRSGAAGAVPDLADLRGYPDTAISASAARVQPIDAGP